MLVPHMNLVEIKKSVLDDFYTEVNQKIKAIKVMYKGKWLRNGKKDFTETISFTTKKRNDWRITIACQQSVVITTPYLVWYDKIGITACSVPDMYENPTLLFFNTHFFKRYKERNKLEIDKPEDVVKFFFKKNSVFIPCYQTRENNTPQLFIPVAGGLGLGNYYLDKDICEFKTFVDDSLLRLDQLQQAQQIYYDEIQELLEEIKKRTGQKRSAEKSWF